MRILYLEDSQPDTMLVRMYMDSVGHEFIAADSLHKARHVLETQHPDIFMTDIVIGSDRSYNLIRQASNQHYARHIIAVTARAFPAEQQEYLKLGCSLVIAKPFTIDDLEEALAQLA